ncbi:MAG: rod shape-determining protein MreC [Elusimicrobia bacterium]|nr:rod shape-determining protein MreC [Elusimicrobiota bacterium]
MQEEYLPSRRSNLIFILLITINLFFLTSHLNVYVKTLKYFLYYIFNPSPSVAEKVVESSGNILKNISEIVNVHQENAVLRKEIEKYTYLEKDFLNISGENERLKKILNLDFPIKYKPIIARVIERESLSWFEWISIDKGYEDGLYSDAPVLAWAEERLVALGRVWEVYSRSAKIILITNVLCSLPVEIKDTKEDGLIDGKNNNILRLNYLLPESFLKPGDEVVTSPISQVFPAGITVGYVKEIFAPVKTSTLKEGTVKPAFISNSLKMVAVLISRQKEKNAQ